jgi:hypothetical protein
MTDESIPIRQVAAKLDDIAEALDGVGSTIRTFIDTSSGEVVWISEAAFEELEHAREQFGEDMDPEALVAAAEGAATFGLDAEPEELLEAARVDAGFGVQFLEIEPLETYESYEIMESFVESVTDTRRRDLLERAIHGKGAFRRFRDTVAEDPEEQQSWYDFKQESLRSRARQWLQANALRLIEDA